METSQTETCLNCGTLLKGNYCSNCGQKKIDIKDRSVFTFLKYFFNEFFNWDSKFFSSIKYVFFKPGYLTTEYSKGRLANYITPLKLYLCMSIAAFLIMSKAIPDQYTNAGLADNTEDNIFAEWVKDIRESKNISEENFKDRFNSDLNNKLSLYLLIIVFLFSLPLKLIEIKKFYIEHLAFAFHFFTFVLLCFTLDTFLSMIHEDLTWIDIFIIPFIYLLFAAKRFYNYNWLITIIVTGALAFYYTMLMFALVTFAILVTSVWV